ncbi:unnamed protein product [Natator depressus]
MEREADNLVNVNTLHFDAPGFTEDKCHNTEAPTDVSSVQCAVTLLQMDSFFERAKGIVEPRIPLKPCKIYQIQSRGIYVILPSIEELTGSGGRLHSLSFPLSLGFRFFLDCSHCRQ